MRRPIQDTLLFNFKTHAQIGLRFQVMTNLKAVSIIARIIH
ncbi:hypothetical protein COXBURSA334_1230 [Coxiella burnetii Q321]|uniref:Uncharacterized protein n=1 Tax=Coxiella burnetii (strain Dugway 5J108-111) TaxID=434922 RepID=B5XHD9_COXBN|nr:hypothetical protein CBUD_1282a [Coxiella burnetii Dugway 5J108-111]EDR35899.1 hypothetical protein COXBURSA334_1230 [Coxiella burnetii Q321]